MKNVFILNYFNVVYKLGILLLFNKHSDIVYFFCGAAARRWPWLPHS